MNLGFSLLELSIVLVISALLAGGLAAGKEIIRQSEIRGVFAEVEKVRVSFHTFKDKYRAAPGDMKNATAYWGVKSAGCPHGAPTGTETCNGNGDGKIQFPTSLFDEDHQESWYAWQHLANAGFIQGTFSGSSNWTKVRTARVNQAVVGTNVLPSQSMSGVAYFLYYSPFSAVPASAGDFLFNLEGTILVAGRYLNGYPLILPHGAFTSEEAIGIEKKFDDGKPAAGNMWWLGIDAFGSPTTKTCLQPGPPMPPDQTTFSNTGNARACNPHMIIR